MGHYQFYIDDSGTKEYAKCPSDYSSKGNSRYFCFGGLLITTDVSAELGDKLAKLKRCYFGTDNVEIKSNWLRIPKEREARYLHKYNLCEQDLSEFVSEVYNILSEADLMLIAAVVDKVHMQEDYAQPWYAPAIAYEILMQRAVQAVRHPDSLSIFIDDMDGATPKGNQYKSNLRRHHQQLRQKGSSLRRGLDYTSLRKLRFLDSATSHHIQLADIVAYNVLRQFVQHGEEWEDQEKKELPTYQWLQKIAKKFRHEGGRIQGYGIIKMPLRKRIQWGVK